MQNQLDIIILAAGFGTRLYPLTSNLPKALLEIGHKTILDRIMSRVILIDRHTRIFLVANSKFYSHFETWAAAFKQSYNLNGDILLLDDGKYSNEERLGPIGDINFVLEKFNIINDLMIIASDNVISYPCANSVTRLFWLHTIFMIVKQLRKNSALCSSILITDFSHSKKSRRTLIRA